MPGGFPAGMEVCNPNGLANAGGNNYNIDFFSVSGYTVNTKGAWVQLIASCPSDVCLLAIYAKGFETSSKVTSVLFDIGVGASGSEQVIISNVLVSANAGQSERFEMVLPVQIPAGTRLAIRYQSYDVTDQTYPFWLWIVGYDGSFTQMEGTAGVDGLGLTLTSRPYSTAFTPGVSGAYGSWTQIISSTSRDYMGLAVKFDSAALDSNFPAVLIDVAVGASGSEQIILKDAVYGSQQHSQTTDFYAVRVPSGSRLSIRGSINTTIGSGALYGAALYGVYL